MDRKTFESLTLEQQLIFVNKRQQMTTKQIADEIGMPPSSLSKIFTEKGYKRIRGKYVKKEKLSSHKEPSELSPFEELLQYKDQLIDIALQKQHQQPQLLDFSVLSQFKRDKETITFDCPAELSQKLNEVLTKRGYKKQALLSLLIYHFLQSQS